MNYNKIKLYGKTLLLKRGVMVSAILTFRCNLCCPYCILKSTGGTPKSKESTFEQWRELFTKFPVKVREVIITGGEPTLHPDFVKIVNWLLDEGYHVKVQTNLTDILGIYWIKSNYRLRIVATYHHSYSKEVFNKRYEWLSERHRIDVHELAYPKDMNKPESKLLPYSTLMPILNKDGLPKHSFRINPNRHISIGCEDAINSAIK